MMDRTPIVASAAAAVLVCGAVLAPSAAAASTMVVGGSGWAAGSPTTDGIGAVRRGALAAHLTAPAVARAGRLFTVSCHSDSRLSGFRVRGFIDGARINAVRTVSRNGNCGMRLVTGQRGSLQITFKLVGSRVSYRTSAVTVTIR